MKTLPLLILLSCLLLVFLTTGCEDHIEDLDESSHELTTLTTEDFTAGSYSSTSSGVNISTQVSGYTIAEDTQDIDYDYIKRSGGKTSGVFSFMGTRLSAGESLRIETSVTPESGNIGLAMISSAGELMYLFSIEGTDAYSFTAEENGIYIVRAAMESFSGDVVVERSWE